MFLAAGSIKNANGTYVTQVHNVNAGGTYVIEFIAGSTTITTTNNCCMFDSDDLTIEGLW